MKKEPAYTASVTCDHARASATIKGEVPFSALRPYRARALAHLGKNLVIDGFRKGNIPEAVLLQHVGEHAVLTHMATYALQRIYPAIIEEHELEVIGRPQITLSTLTPEQPLAFTATVTLMPTVSLPDFKAIAKEKNTHRPSSQVSNEEVEEQITDILRQKAAYEKLQKSAAKNKGEEQEALPTTPPEEAAGDSTDEAPPSQPELTDTLVATLGRPGQFTDVADFKAKVREHLHITKTKEDAAQHRAAITDAIIDATDVPLPELLIQAELEQLFSQMEHDLARAQLSMEAYLSHIQKTREELAAQWEPGARKRAKLQLILSAIAREEEILPDPARVTGDVEAFAKAHPQANKKQVEAYFTTTHTNEAVLAMLEAQ